MSTSALSKRHISELHDRAAELSIDGYRMLGRDQLVEAILAEDPDAEKSAPAPGSSQAPASERGDRGGRGGGGERGGRDAGGRRSRGEGRSSEAKEAAPLPEGPVEGPLEISGRGHGFIRLSGDQPAEGDIYISASQIRRCDLNDGDVVAGPARPPRRGERHPALVHVDTVNGDAPGGGSAKFSELTAIPSSRSIDFDLEAADEADRAALEELKGKTPLLFGHRVLIRAGANQERTRFVRSLASVLGAGEGFETIVVLIDELPEQLADWQKVEGIELVSAPADLRSREQARIAERTAAKAMRAVESGDDVVLVIDSLSRLAAAADDAGFVKPIFGAGRETDEEETGSLTVIATTIDGAGDEGAVDRALATTENVLIVLDELLPASG